MTQTITSMTVKNYKGIDGEITLHPEGNSLVVIAGANGSGKSSFIDAIAEIFDPKGTKLTVKPIHNGAGGEETFSEVVTDIATLRRTWKKNDAGTLDVRALDTGKLYASGKEFVKSATGGALFDSNEFVLLSEKDQRAKLLTLVSLPFDLAQIDDQRATLYADRTNANGNRKTAEAQLAAFPPVDPTLPATETSAASVLAELDRVREHNASGQALQSAAAAATRAREAAYAETERLLAAFEVAKAQALACREQEVAADQEARAVMFDPSEQELKARLDSTEETNARIRAQQARATAATALEQRIRAHQDLEEAIKAIDRTKADGLAAADFPAGLGIDDTGITYAGVPFKQVNTAKQAIVAFDLFSRENPDLRLAILKNGDMLDEETVTGIKGIADERGYLVLMERGRTDNTRPVGLTVTVAGGKAVSA